MSEWTTQAPVAGQAASAANGTVSLFEPACEFGSDPPGGTVGYWGRYPDQNMGYALYNLAPAALRVFDSASGTKTIEAKITAYGGTGGPGDGHSKHRIGFATANMESAYYLEWAAAGISLYVRKSGVAYDDDIAVASSSFSEEPSADHPIWIRLILVVGASITADFSETDRATWVAMPDIPVGTGTEFTPSQYVIALHTVSNGWGTTGSVTYSRVTTDEDSFVLQDLQYKTGVPRVVFAKIDGCNEIYFQRHHLGMPPPEVTKVHYACLAPPVEYSMSLDIGNMAAGMSAMTLDLKEFADNDGTLHFAKLFSSARWDDNPHARLAETSLYNQQVDADSATLPLIDSGDLPSSGNVWVGQEMITYTGISDSNTLTGCTKGVHPIAGAAYGFTLPLATKQTGQYGMAAGTVPFSWRGRRVALYVLSYDYENEAWQPISQAYRLWAGRIAGMPKYVGAKREYSLDCASIMDELDTEICSDLPTGELEWINLYGDAGRTFTIMVKHAWNLEISGMALSWYYSQMMEIAIPKGIYTAEELRGYINALLIVPSNWTIYDSKDAAPAKRYTVGFIKTASTNSIIADYHYSGDLPLQADLSVYSSGYDQSIGAYSIFCHALCALGFNGRSTYAEAAQTTVAGWADPVLRARIDGDTEARAYHPVSNLCNGRLLYLAGSRLIGDQGDGDGYVEVLKSAKIVSDKPDAPVSKYPYLVRLSALTNGVRTIAAPLDPAYSIDLTARVEQRYGEDPCLFQTVLCPTYRGTHVAGPYEMLLRIICSTGTPGYNGAYDVLPRRFGLGIQQDLIDADSFIDADRVAAKSELGQRKLYVIDKPVKVAEMVSREAKLWGYPLVWSDGKITARPTLAPPVDSWLVELSDGTRADRDTIPSSSKGSETIINKYHLKVVDPLSKDFDFDFTITDMDSASCTETRTVEIAHPGIKRRVTGNRGMLFSALVLGRPTRYASDVVEVTLAPFLIGKVNVGDVVLYSSSHFPDPMGTGSFSTSCYALVTGMSWDYAKWQGRATLMLLAQFQGYGTPWAPTLLINRGHATGGFDAETLTVHVSPVAWGNVTTDDYDVNAYAPGHMIKITERSPADHADVQSWDPIEITSMSPTGSSLTIGTNIATGYNANVEYIVIPCDFANTATNQRAYSCWMANNKSGKVLTTRAARYG